MSMVELVDQRFSQAQLTTGEKKEIFIKTNNFLIKVLYLIKDIIRSKTLKEEIKGIDKGRVLKGKGNLISMKKGDIEITIEDK